MKVPKIPEIKVPRMLERNFERYLTLLAGFFLFVAPFALFTRLAFAISGENAEATLHSICYRLPLDWIDSGFTHFFSLGVVASVFVIGVIAVAFLFGPIFCGKLCPVGAISEIFSRLIPLPNKYRLKIRNPKTTMSLRYGFFLGFLIAGWLAGSSAACTYGVDVGRYCSSSLLQFFSLGLFADQVNPNFWNAGLVLSLVMWLMIGGVMMVGGRGWCLFICPLGAVSGLAHKAGELLGLQGMEFNTGKCRSCRKCDVSCPMWAIDEQGRVEKALCIGCGECKHNCSFGSYNRETRRIELWSNLSLSGLRLK